MTPGHLDIIAKGRMISDGNPLKQCYISKSSFLGQRCGEDLQSHVYETTVEIGIGFQMPSGEILVFRCNPVDLESGG